MMTQQTFPVFISHTYYVKIVKNDQKVTKIVPIILMMIEIRDRFVQ